MNFLSVLEKFYKNLINNIDATLMQSIKLHIAIMPKNKELQIIYSFSL